MMRINKKGIVNINPERITVINAGTRRHCSNKRRGFYWTFYGIGPSLCFKTFCCRQEQESQIVCNAAHCGPQKRCHFYFYDNFGKPKVFAVFGRRFIISLLHSFCLLSLVNKRHHKQTSFKHNFYKLYQPFYFIILFGQ